MTTDEIRRLRDLAGVTQTELATLLGVTSTTIYKWERGTNRPNDWQVAMLDAFDAAERKVAGTLRRVVKALYSMGYARALHEALMVAFSEEPG